MKTTRTPAFAKASAGRHHLIAAAVGFALGGLIVGTAAAQAALSAEALAAADDPLPSWNGGPARGNWKRGTN